MSVLRPRKTPRRERKLFRFNGTSPPVITLEDEGEERMIDLTDQDDPEIIVLEDSIVQTGRITRQSSKNNSVIDLTEVTDSSKTLRKESENYINVVNVKRSKPQKLSYRNTPGGKVNMSSALNTPKKRKRLKKNKRKSYIKSLSRTINNSINSGSLISLSSTDSLPRKKIKLQDISNIHSATPCSTSSFTQPTVLSENTQKYYENISKAVVQLEKAKVKIHQRNNKKINRFTPQKNLTYKAALNQRRKYIERSSLLVQNSPDRPNRILRKKLRSSLRKIGETNAFNPSPCQVDLEGLRPIVIDGCNVAIGHGKGSFSPKGLKICVDYFSARGHSKIKVFLPQFRQAEFSTELLEALRSKCDVVFTPSLCISGQRRTPYDDRFIVQYATEFGGVIVSTDNYRDISRENPRWQDTIEKRLLMFTWVDDFLMFPVDPLGRSGPTLEEFLKF